MTYSTTKKDYVPLPPEIQAQRQPCEIWQRVMGYMRPMSQWNIGKRSEGYSREYFDHKLTMDSLDAAIAANDDFNENFK